MIAFSLADVKQMYYQVWGITPIVIPPKGSGQQAQSGGFTGTPAAPAKTTVGEYGSPFSINDVIGREVYLPVQILIPQASGPALSMWLDYPVVRITGKNTIVETQMTERKGNVHEIINLDDYDITVKGFIINQESNDVDDETFNSYFDLLEVGQQVSMRSVLTDRALHPDYQVVVKRLEFPEVTAIQGVKPYQIDFVSDFIYTLTKS